MVQAGLLTDDCLTALGATVIPTGTGNTELQIRIMHDLKVTVYFGTPSYLMTLFKKAEEMGYDVHHDFALRLGVFAAEPYPPSLRKIFEQDYNINTSQVYAVSELGGAFSYECSHKSGWHIAEEMIVEIVNPETGKQLGPGEVGEMYVH